jgi:hypothetical protein
MGSTHVLSNTVYTIPTFRHADHTYTISLYYNLHTRRCLGNFTIPFLFSLVPDVQREKPKQQTKAGVSMGSIAALSVIADIYGGYSSCHRDATSQSGFRRPENWAQIRDPDPFVCSHSQPLCQSSKAHRNGESGFRTHLTEFSLCTCVPCISAWAKNTCALHGARDR